MTFVCLCISIYQNFILLRNFFNYDTVRKIEEKNIEGPMLTPDVIFCQDPPNFNSSHDLITGPISSWRSNIGVGYNFLREANVTVRKLTTFYKVIVKKIVKRGQLC